MKFVKTVFCIPRDIQGIFLLCGPGPQLCASRWPVTACHEAHIKFADESACLTASNVQNEVVTIHRSQEVLKMLLIMLTVDTILYNLSS
jgi:hypothetical protein